MWGTVIAIGVVIVVVGLYLWSYSLNEKTEKPEGCVEIECHSCHDQSCSNRK